MDWIQAAGWGLAGGLAAGLAGLASAVTAVGYRWPWSRPEYGPRLVLFGLGLLLGTILATAVHGQISGGLPAFLIGASAPAVIRNLISHIEVEARPTANEKKRETQIIADAESLAKARESSPNSPAPHGISADLAEILASRREALAGELPVVSSLDEGREAS
jgi:hypothetical protein